MNVPGISPREEIYRAALTASRLFSSSIDCPLEETFSRLSTLLVEELGARLVTIGRLNRDDLSLKLIAVAGPAADYARGLHLSAAPESPMGQGPAGRVLRSGKPMVAMLPDDLPASLDEWKERVQLHGLGGSALAPIHTREGLWGLLTVYRESEGSFNPDILPVLVGFSDDIGAFLERRSQYRELQARRAFQAALETLQGRFLSGPSDPEILRELVLTLVDSGALPDAWILEGEDLPEGGEDQKFHKYGGGDLGSSPLQELLIPALRKILGKDGSYPRFLEISEELFPGISTFPRRNFSLKSLMLFPLAFFPDHRPATLLVAAFSSSHHPPEAVVDLLAQVASSAQLALSQRQDRIRLERYAAFYRAMGESGQLMARHPPAQDLFDGLCDLLVRWTPLELAFVSLVEDGLKVRVVSARGRARSFLERAVFSIDPEDEERCLIHSRTLDSEGVLPIPFLEGWLCSDEVRKLARPWGLRNTLTVAIRKDGKAIGILGLVSSQKGFFDPTLENLLEGLSQDISFSLEFQDRQDQLARISTTDALTGLFNRHAFSLEVTRALSRVRMEETGLSVGILDLDGFKGWNDAYGHSEGDRLLKELALLLREIVPKGGVLARLGGDEFGFCLSGPPTEVRNISETFSLEVLRLVQRVDHGLNLVTGSLGWALLSDPGEGFRDLLAHADEALYVAKRSGRNTYRFFGGEIARALQRRIDTHRSFPLALEKGDLIFWLQPQLDCRTGRIEGVEMLARWRQGDRILLPGSFMPEVEKDPVMIRLLGVHALRHARVLRERFLRAGRSLRISLNIGASHFLHGDFLENVRDAVGEDGGSGLVLEVTESAALEDMPRTTRLTDELKRRGFGVSLDDFGTGYSSLHHAADLSMTEIKLDAYFLRRFRTHTNAFAVVGSTLLLAELSGSRLVGEGIEFAEDLDLWLRMGGRLIQGYLLARPMPEEEILSWLGRPLPREVSSSPPVYPVEDLPFLEYAFRPRSFYEERTHLMKSCPLDLWFDLRGHVYDHLSSWNESRESHRKMHPLSSGGPSPSVVDRFCRAIGSLREEMDAYRLTINTPP